jgi:hypothetical protein
MKCFIAPSSPDGLLTLHKDFNNALITLRIGGKKMQIKSFNPSHFITNEKLNQELEIFDGIKNYI